MGGAGEGAPPASGARGWRLGPHRGLGGRGRPRREAGWAGESASESIRTYELRFVPGAAAVPGVRPGGDLAALPRAGGGRAAAGVADAPAADPLRTAGAPAVGG